MRPRISLASWLRALLLTAMAVTAGAADAVTPHLYIHSVEILGYTATGFRVAVDLPCGAEYYGMVLRPDRNRRLTVAAAVMQGPVLCTVIGKPLVVEVDYVDVTAFAEIAPLSLATAARVSLVRLSDVRPASRGKGVLVTAPYDCGKAAGLLVRDASQDRLQLAYVQATPKPGAPSPCRATPRQDVVAGLTRKAARTAVPLTPKSTTLSRAFVLRVVRPDALTSFAAAAGGSIRQEAAPGLSVRYTRHCNEAPIGVVVGAARGAATEVGVLVAAYPNLTCPFSTADETATVTVRELAHLADAAPFAQTADGWQLQAPTALTARGAQRISLQYTARCAAVAFAVYAADHQGRLALGILTLDNADDCRRAPVAAVLPQPALTTPPTTLLPLQLKGA